MILLSALFLITLWVLFFYFLYRVTNNSSLVDTAWSLGMGLLALYYYFSIGISDFRQLALLFCVLAWSLRLAALLIQRLLRGHTDQRYVDLDAHWSRGKFFLFYMVQAIAAWILATPFYLAMGSRLPATFLDAFAFVLFVVAFSGEVIADWQMSAFRQDKSNRGEVYRKGLWRYSRHPNYFFESLIWFSFSLFALSVPGGMLGLVSPLLITLFLIKITGIPPTEEALLASKGEKYREYQRSTNAFIPWFPK